MAIDPSAEPGAAAQRPMPALPRLDPSLPPNAALLRRLAPVAAPVFEAMAREAAAKEQREAGAP